MGEDCVNAEVEIDDLVIAAVPSTMVDFIWPQCIPHMQRVVDKAPDDVSIEKTYSRLIAGDRLLITIMRGTDVVAINILNVEVLDSGKRCLTVPIVGGDEMDLWMDRFLVIAEQIAKDYNCTALRGFAVRKGWLRKLRDFGWKPLHTIVQHELGED